MLRDGAVIAYPTDSSYALGCHLGDADALRRLRQLRGVDDKHHLTLVCADLSELGKYARVDNRAFRLLKLATPGPYTFILEGTREVPKRLLHPKRATLGLRVPDHPVVQALLTELGEPILSATLIPPDEDVALNDPEAIAERMPASLGLILMPGKALNWLPPWLISPATRRKCCALATARLIASALAECLPGLQAAGRETA